MAAMVEHPPPIGNASVRSRVTVVCTECKRLKLKCDRKRPCHSCLKRDHADLCEYIPVAKDQPDVQTLHTRISALESAMQVHAKNFAANQKQVDPVPATAIHMYAQGIHFVLDDASQSWADILLGNDHPLQGLTMVPVVNPTPDLDRFDFMDVDASGWMDLLPPPDLRPALLINFGRFLRVHTGVNMTALGRRVTAFLEGESTGRASLALAAAAFALGSLRIDTPMPEVDTDALFALSEHAIHSFELYEDAMPPTLDYVLTLMLHVHFRIQDGRRGTGFLHNRAFPTLAKAVAVGTQMGLALTGVISSGEGQLGEEVRRRIWWELIWLDTILSEALSVPPLVPLADVHALQLPAMPATHGSPDKAHALFGHYRCRLLKLLRRIQARQSLYSNIASGTAAPPEMPLMDEDDAMPNEEEEEEDEAAMLVDVPPEPTKPEPVPYMLPPPQPLPVPPPPDGHSKQVDNAVSVSQAVNAFLQSLPHILHPTAPGEMDVSAAVLHIYCQHAIVSAHYPVIRRQSWAMVPLESVVSLVTCAVDLMENIKEEEFTGYLFRRLVWRAGNACSVLMARDPGNMCASAAKGCMDEATAYLEKECGPDAAEFKIMKTINVRHTHFTKRKEGESTELDVEDGFEVPFLGPRLAVGQPPATSTVTIVNLVEEEPQPPTVPSHMPAQEQSSAKGKEKEKRSRPTIVVRNRNGTSSSSRQRAAHSASSSSSSSSSSQTQVSSSSQLPPPPPPPPHHVHPPPPPPPIVQSQPVSQLHTIPEGAEPMPPTVPSQGLPVHHQVSPEPQAQAHPHAQLRIQMPSHGNVVKMEPQTPNVRQVGEQTAPRHPIAPLPPLRPVASVPSMQSASTPLSTVSSTHHGQPFYAPAERHNSHPQSPVYVYEHQPHQYQSYQSMPPPHQPPTPYTTDFNSTIPYPQQQQQGHPPLAQHAPHQQSGLAQTAHSPHQQHHASPVEHHAPHQSFASDAYPSFAPQQQQQLHHHHQPHQEHAQYYAAHPQPHQHHSVTPPQHQGAYDGAQQVSAQYQGTFYAAAHGHAQQQMEPPAVFEPQMSSQQHQHQRERSGSSEAGPSHWNGGSQGGDEPRFSQWMN